MVYSKQEFIKAMEKAMGPDFSRKNTFFAYHNCYKCEHGEKPCVGDKPVCQYPHARND